MDEAAENGVEGEEDVTDRGKLGESNTFVFVRYVILTQGCYNLVYSCSKVFNDTASFRLLSLYAARAQLSRHVRVHDHEVQHFDGHRLHDDRCLL
jgi:hypothetical protein